MGNQELQQKWRSNSWKKLYRGKTLLGKFKKLRLLPKRVSLQNAKFYSERIVELLLEERRTLEVRKVSNLNLNTITIMPSERLVKKTRKLSSIYPRSDYFEKYNIDKDSQRVYAHYHI
jgi:hypothetical protein